MDCLDQEKPLRKNLDKKNEKRIKTKVKMPHVNKKSLARKRIFVRTPFSLSLSLSLSFSKNIPDRLPENSRREIRFP